MWSDFSVRFIRTETVITGLPQRRKARWTRGSSHSLGGVSIRSGDEILVLPKVDVKSMQIAKDLMQILYQIAISTKVVLNL